jgi:hypothetical protein
MQITITDTGAKLLDAIALQLATEGNDRAADLIWWALEKQREEEEQEKLEAVIADGDRMLPSALDELYSIIDDLSITGS